MENRDLRNLARELPNALPMRTIVILTHTTDIPPEFSDHVVIIPWKFPDREEMARIFDACVNGLKDTIPDPKDKTRVKKIPPPGKQTTPEVREQAIDAAMGLSKMQAQNVFSKSVVTCEGRI